MDSLRLVSPHGVSNVVPCHRCSAGERRWDRIAGQAICPNCQELMIIGEAPPLMVPAERTRCAVCNQMGSLRFQTFPLQSDAAVEIDLCAEHLRSMLGRRLGPHAFHQIRRKLFALGISVEDIFLLHGAFYDSQGHALQPANETI